MGAPLASEPELASFEGGLEAIDDDALETVNEAIEPVSGASAQAGSDDEVADETSMDDLESMGMLDMGEAVGRELDLEAMAEEPALEPEPEPPGAAEAEGDRHAAEGRTSQAMAAYRRALSEDPANEQVLMKIGELLSAKSGSSSSLCTAR